MFSTDERAALHQVLAGRAFERQRTLKFVPGMNFDDMMGPLRLGIAHTLHASSLRGPSQRPFSGLGLYGIVARAEASEILDMEREATKEELAIIETAARKALSFRAEDGSNDWQWALTATSPQFSKARATAAAVQSRVRNATTIARIKAEIAALEPKIMAAKGAKAKELLDQKAELTKELQALGVRRA